jgi:ParB family chromosome partitioning protein
MYNRDEMEKFKKRCCVLRDVRLFINTINKAVETMKAAGIDANASKIQQDGFIEYIVKIPVSK